VVGLDRNGDLVAMARQRLVDGVVHDLPDQVVQAANADVADVHGGALANRLETLEHGDAGGVVVMTLLLIRQGGFSFRHTHRWLLRRDRTKRTSRTIRTPRCSFALRTRSRFRNESSCIQADPSTSTVKTPSRKSVARERIATRSPASAAHSDTARHPA